MLFHLWNDWLWQREGPRLAVVLFSSKKLAFLRITINLCVFLFLSFLRKQICVNHLGSCPSMVHELGLSWVRVYFTDFVLPWLFLSLAAFQSGVTLCSAPGRKMMLQGISKMSAHLNAGLYFVTPVFLFIWLNLYHQSFTMTSDHQLMKMQ